MAVTLDDILTARERIRGRAVLTPLLESPLLNERVGFRVLVKAESLQLAGSFKFRGAFNRISRLDAEQLARGVVAFSSGNHAQGVAAASRYLGARATIVVPRDIPAIKKANTLAWGAALAYYDRDTDDRETIAAGIAEASGAVIVPPFDDETIIAGQGTIGLEICEQAALRGTVPDAVVIPVGGGGLSAGISTAIKARHPEARVFLAEPAEYDDTRRSFAAGARVGLAEDHGRTFCDALTAAMPGRITFPINQTNAEGVLAVDDDTVCRGIATAFLDLKLVLEPSGAIALAAAVSGALGEAYPVAGKTVVVVASGGNVDPATFTDALERGIAMPGAG